MDELGRGSPCGIEAPDGEGRDGKFIADPWLPSAQPAPHRLAPSVGVIEALTTDTAISMWAPKALG